MFVKDLNSIARSPESSNSHYLEHELHHLFGNEKKFAAFVCERLLDGIWIWDLERPDNLYMNAKFWHKLGYHPSGKEHTLAAWKNIVLPEDLQPTLDLFQQRAAQPWHTVNTTLRLKHYDGSTVRVRCRAMLICNEKGKASRLLGMHTDLTDLVLAQETVEEAKETIEKRIEELRAIKRDLRHVEAHDSLTGLPNRQSLEQRLEALRSAPELVAKGVALIYVGLDRFKQLNDTFGHEFGDAALVRAAKVVTELIGGDNFVARIGGDEFVVLHYDAGDVQAIIGLAERIVAQLTAPFIVEDRALRHGASVGVAFPQKDVFDPRALFVGADIALHHAKTEGRNRVQLFTPYMQEEAIKTKQIADEILTALEQSEFIPFFQPQLDARTLDLVGVEALVRWEHPTRGMLAPAAFLQVAEDLNVISKIDEMIMKKSIERIHALNVQGYAIPKLSLNVSMQKLLDIDLIEQMLTLDRHEVTVSLELLESIFFDDEQSDILWTIDCLKEAGYRIEIDDFGSGRASVTCLTEFTPHTLKLDRKLVTPITESERHVGLIAALIEIGKALDISVTAEGVETLEHADILRRLGCDTLQGYAFARPMPSDELAKFIANGGARTAAAEAAPVIAPAGKVFDFSI